MIMVGVAWPCVFVVLAGAGVGGEGLEAAWLGGLGPVRPGRLLGAGV
jgi:hypothetical protein